MANDRLTALQDGIQAAGLDLVALLPSPTFTWLAGHEFTSHERLFVLLVPGTGPPVAVLPLLERGNFSDAVPAVDAIFTWDDKDGPEDAVRQACARFDSVERVGIEPLAMRYMEYSVLARHLTGAQFESADPIISPLRMAKSEQEAAALRRAIAISEEALRATIAEVRVGASERAIAGKLSSCLLLGGGEGISFGPIVLGGPKSALPHGEPGDYELAAGDFLLIDFGTSHHGYHSDITRTFFVGGEPSDRQREVYEAVLAGNRAGCAAASATATAHEVHTRAQAGLHEARFASFMTHRTGHGLGVDIHEPPSVMEGNHQPLGVGTVITVEPGLYLEGFGGVRIEDDLWIGETGNESLTTFERELTVIGR